MGQCTSCAQQTMKTSQVEVVVPSTEETISNNNKQLVNQRNYPYNNI